MMMKPGVGATICPSVARCSPRGVVHLDDSTRSLARGLLDAAPDAIVGVRADGRIALVNAQAERLFGYTREELHGEPVEILIPESGRRLHPHHRSSYLRDPQPRPMGAGMELAGRRRDGSEFPAEISLSAIDSDDGLLITAAVRDVTERKRTEAKFRGLLDSAPDAIVAVLSDGRIALVNAQAERLFGYSRDELHGQLVEILVPEVGRGHHPQHRERYFRDPRPRPMGAQMQLAARRRDGSEFPAEISLSALETEDGLLVSAAIRDVTDRLEAQAERERLRAQAERKQIEAQLHQSQRLESLGQLAGGVAHDFNNLLGVIINYTAFVGEVVATAAERDGGQWEAARHDLEQVQRAAERATQLTHQLLAFGRREVVQPRVLDLNDVVHDIEEMLRRTLGEHVELITLPAADPWLIFADAGQLEQVLVNLAVNARDAMPGGGKLTIDTSNILIHEDIAGDRPGLKAGRHVNLRMSDSGSGMAPETVSRAFEPFFTTKRKGEGSGLGLATVYGIITQAGGHAEILSGVGLGTTVSILLPAVDSVAATPEPISDGAILTGGETVLVVEDERAMREVTRRLLARNGYQVITAADGHRAVELAVSHPTEIDLLLTDVVMPQVLGRTVATLVRRHRPGIRVLFMSGYAYPVLAHNGVLDPGLALLGKPFSEQMLLAKVRDVLDASTED
ncbi:PAS domain S-box protein [Frankia sp. AiPs1]|uniref:hybrid sensor histidine kinase/response regulator n=1 Tax=Frankia sp. AiPs1 TaxID=573493 RepID=UPI002043EE45|nr:PAS domain-containing hybrid sensor histidine kinase/response regulator [Frankia sp. AiPs1]MCM3921645.1 PAS domain S-box protein [Frankia sp. AiPs1]